MTASALERISGVRPSEEWLSACRMHLQETNHDVNEDAILHQILHTDLRHVVARPNATAAAAAAPLEEGPPPPQQLRQAIQASLAASGKASLPESFRLLVQVEEVLDVSVNAETRLSLGPASRTAPTPVGNQHHRCLKLYVSDGYPCPTTTTTTTMQQHHHHHMIAMEIPPLLTDLSVHSRAGIKVLLNGPLLVRLGVLLWHAGNATVLGGSVERLVRAQTQALQQAHRVAGVGVDPTVRALIWNPEAGMEEEEQDEGEQHSGDVVAAPAPQTTPGALQQPVQATPALLPLQQQQQQQQQATATMIPPTQAVAPQHSSSRPYSRTSATHQATTTTPTPAPPAAGPTTHSSSVPQEPSSASSSTNPRSTNPYANPYSQSSSRSASATTAATLPRLPAQPKPTSGALDLTEASSVSHSHRTIDTAAASFSSSSQETIDLVTPTNEATTTTTPATTAVNHTTAAASRRSSVASQHSIIDREQQSSQDVELLSFSELKALLQRARSNEDVYREQEGKIFVVPCKMKDKHIYFNIHKKKHRDKKKDKNDKYEYVMDIPLGGPLDADGTITANISNEVLLQYFALKPGEMRQLSRQDRAKSQAYVNEGGKHVKADLMVLASWQLTLLHSAKEFFQMDPIPELDGETSILRMTRRHDGT